MAKRLHDMFSEWKRDMTLELGDMRGSKEISPMAVLNYFVRKEKNRHEAIVPPPPVETEAQLPGMPDRRARPDASAGVTLPRLGYARRGSEPSPQALINRAFRPRETGNMLLPMSHLSITSEGTQAVSTLPPLHRGSSSKFFVPSKSWVQ